MRRLGRPTRHHGDGRLRRCRRHLVAALGLDRPHVCGISFGGGLAIAVYQRHPNLARSLVLAGAYAGWKGSLAPAEVQARLERVRAELDLPPAVWIDSYLPGFFAGPPAPESLELVRSIMLEVRPAGVLPMMTCLLYTYPSPRDRS